MNVKVLLFGIAAETAGTRSATIEINHEASINEALAEIKTRYPKLPDMLYFSFALNGNYVSDQNKVLNDGDELAILPPVSGG